jgi:hypothetical protein
MPSLIRSLAFAAGAGIAIGICTTANRTANKSRRATRREPVRPLEVSSDQFIDIEPLLSRLETMERRFEAVSVPAPEPAVDTVELTRRLDAQDVELERLRGLVDARARAIHAQLEAEIEERHLRSIAALEHTVEVTISDRIAALERNLMNHATSIEELRDGAVDTEANLKRLIVAIEKLVERSQPAPQAAAPVLVPFEANLHEVRRQDEAPEEPKKSRFPMARIFGMIALTVATCAFSQILG